MGMQITDVRVRRIEKEGKMKAIVSIILVLGLLVCLTGCGENEKKQEAIDEFNTTAAAFNEVKDLVNANASEIPEDVSIRASSRATRSTAMISMTR